MTTRVLVSVASKHGSTTEIGEVIGHTLQDKGLGVDIVPPAVVDSLADYDAVILGSAVYLGRWLSPAQDFVVRFHDELSRRPVWLFPAVRSATRPGTWPGHWTEKTQKASPRSAGTSARWIITCSRGSSTPECSPFRTFRTRYFTACPATSATGPRSRTGQTVSPGSYWGTFPETAVAATDYGNGHPCFRSASPMRRATWAE
jgi:Flavodoxin domain